MTPSRRRFLLDAGMLSASGIMIAQLPPVEKLIELILKDTVRSAHADSEYVTSKYINVSMFGAPPRWIFDHFLQTRATENINPSPMASTIYVSSSGTYQSAAYQTVDYKGVRVPPLWNTQVIGGSGQRPLSDLLDHMILFRGYGTGVDGHPSNAAKQTYPVGGVGSVSGIMADQSSTLFKAIQFPALGQASGYSSPRGTGLTAINFGSPTNYASQVLSSFGARGETPGLNSLRNRYADLIANAQSVLTAFTRGDHPDFPPVAADQQAALNKIKLGVPGLDDVWNGLYNKYLNIANQTFHNRSSPGFNDQPIVPTQDDGTSVDTLYSLQTPPGPKLYPDVNQDIRDWVNGIDLTQFAATFALAEYAVTNNLVSAYELGLSYPGGLTGQFVRQDQSSFASTKMTQPLVFDQHGTGLMVGLFLNSCLFRTVGACMLELIDQLKAKNMFDSTVIHMTTDFGRIPRNTGGGADHGFDSMVASVFTGQQTGGPMVLGNILASGSNATFDPNVYTGSFGFKAPTNVAGQSIILNPAFVTSSLAQLLKLPKNPWGNIAQPLVTVNGATLKAQASGDIV